MPILFVHDGKEFDIDDVPLADYAQIERDHGTPWWKLCANPMQYAGAGEALARICARLAGVDLPTLTPRLLVKLFEVRAGENRPTEYNDGMPDPKAQGSGPETTSSSGSPSP